MVTPPAGPRRSSFPVSHPCPDVVCLSHLRWDFVFQRPQHLMTRWARSHRVFFVEEPIDIEGPPRLDVHIRQQGVQVLVPRFPRSIAAPDATVLQSQLLRRFFTRNHITDYLLWYYTPMAVEFTRDMTPRAVVYDCMDELSAFAGAPAEIPLREKELLRRAQLVFTGGSALYEHKRNCHPNVHPFPSSVDVAHFARARVRQADPVDQRYIPHPRLGFFGVIDERLDATLLARLAALRPDWQLVMIGPTVKIDPAVLPRGANIHYLGPKRYDDLPAYLAGWDVALLPFARNDATRFISPTKTPEYLAAGKPVVSTSIRDVVRPYGARGLARIADTAEGFAAAIELAMAEDPIERQRDADAFLTQTSWDGTWTRMHRLVLAALSQSEPLAIDGDIVSEPGVA